MKSLPSSQRKLGSIFAVALAFHDFQGLGKSKMDSGFRRNDEQRRLRAYMTTVATP